MAKTRVPDLPPEPYSRWSAQGGRGDEPAVAVYESAPGRGHQPASRPQSPHSGERLSIDVPRTPQGRDAADWKAIAFDPQCVVRRRTVGSLAGTRVRLARPDLQDLLSRARPRFSSRRSAGRRRHQENQDKQRQHRNREPAALLQTMVGRQGVSTSRSCRETEWYPRDASAICERGPTAGHARSFDAARQRRGTGLADAGVSALRMLEEGTT
jgi:hypothetical protein